MAYCDVCSTDGAKRYRVGRMKLRLCRLCRPMMADLIRCCDTCLKYDRDGMRCRRTQGHISDAESMSCAGWQIEKLGGEKKKYEMEGEIDFTCLKK